MPEVVKLKSSDSYESSVTVLLKFLQRWKCLIYDNI